MTPAPHNMSSSVSPLNTSGDRSPNSPISPKTIPDGSNEYFDASPSAAPPVRLESITEHVKADHAQRPRAASSPAISFRAPPRIPQSPRLGQPRARPRAHLKTASPERSSRFRNHVSFSNYAGGEATPKNILSYTLNVSHRGYQQNRRSKSFMVGIDEHDYSDIALTWLLDELVDDGDQVICLRVVPLDHKLTTEKRKEHQNAANEMMERIKSRNNEHKSINIILEYALGKLQTTFQRIIQLYSPQMLIVGTKGRSLGGIQGLVSNHNSFSRWCLQSSPIPVIVVRPTDKRLRKKNKRSADPERQDYARILKDSGVGWHEADWHETADVTRSDALEITSAEFERRAVSTALGLPASFDPSKSYLEGSRPLHKVDSEKSDATAATSLSPDSRPSSPNAVLKSPKSAGLESPAMSGNEAEDSGEDDEEGEFETMPGHLLLQNDHAEVVQKQKLHAMEQDEAGALLHGRKASIGSASSSGSGGGGEGGGLLDDEEEEENETNDLTPRPDESDVVTSKSEDPKPGDDGRYNNIAGALDLIM